MYIPVGGIYVHIPFCKTHCTYCAFYSELLRHPQGSESFVAAIIAEIASCQLPVPSGDPRASRSAPPTQSVGPSPCMCPGVDTVSLRARGAGETLYFGGGTPSVLTLEQLQRIVSAIFDSGLTKREEIAEFTMEVNPDDVVKNGPDYIRGLKDLGVNRISMGVQSFDDAVLHKMGRRHNAAQAREAYSMLRKAGMDNISLDFIFGFSADLDVVSMREGLLEMGLPEHISCYQLSIEEGSGLDRMAQRGLFTMPDDEVCESQYYAICDMLRSLGYEHYEISNWCLPGRHSRHNSAYWNHTPYLGFGPGAHSLIIGEDGTYMRRWNENDLSRYLEAAADGNWSGVRGFELLTDEQIREERLFLGLRTAAGVDGITIPEEKWFISDNIIADML